MPQMGGGSGGRFDYIQSATPEDPQNGEMWFDLDGGSDGTGEVKVYDGASGAWEVTGYTSHGDLTGVTPDAHHSPVSVSDPLTEDGEQGLGLSVGDGLEVSGGTLLAALKAGVLTTDSSGAVTVAADAVTEEMLAFATATQSELDSLASATSSDLSALDTALTDHATRTDNPHQVSDDQTGAASALSAHASDPDRHHSRYSDNEARDAAPVQSVNGNTGDVNGLATDSALSSHVSDADAHHSRPTQTGTNSMVSAGRMPAPSTVFGFVYSEVKISTTQYGVYSANLVYADGSQDTHSLEDRESRWVNTQAKPLVDMTGDTADISIEMVNKLVAVPHSHNI